MKKLFYLLVFSGTVLLVNAQSEIHESNSKVGIGTATPAGKLQVADNVNGNNNSAQIEATGQSDSSKRLSLGYDVQSNTGFIQSHFNGGNSLLLLNPNGGKIGVNTTTPYYDFEIKGGLSSLKYKLGTDLCILPVQNGQSIISTWWGLQLIGNKQAETDAPPSNIGQNSDFSVAIPNQQPDKVGLLVQGATNQTGDLMQWQDKQGTVMAKVNNLGHFVTRRLRVTQQPWADYVFHATYKLPSLRDVERFVRMNHHLPEVPTAAEVDSKGVDVADTQALLLKKVEELTLYIIELNKKVEHQQSQLQKLRQSKQR